MTRPSWACIAAAMLAASASPAVPGDLRPPPPAPRLGTCGSAGGGFLIPGTEACLTLGGAVRTDSALKLAAPTTAFVETGLGGRPSNGWVGRRALDRATLGADARLTADVRVPTDYGPARLFVSIRARDRSGADRTAR